MRTHEVSSRQRQALRSRQGTSEADVARRTRSTESGHDGRVTMRGAAPPLWSQAAGADAMRRVAAPTVRGFFTGAFLTLEIIPVVHTNWRCRQLRHEQKGLNREVP